MIAVTARLMGGLVAALSLAGQAFAGPLDVQPHDRVLGRADAPVTVVEYASFTCPHCADWHAEVLPTLKSRYIDTGKVRLVYRDLPTPPAEVAATASAIARCSVPERFYDVAGVLMRGQARLYESQQTGPWFQAALAASGRTEAEMEACLADPATLQGLRDGIAVAQGLGVTSTPSVFVNGRRLTDTSLAGVEAAIAPLID